jgi:hypothetical protein
MKWIKTYLREITAETYTFVGLLTAYFTLDGSKKSDRTTDPNWGICLAGNIAFKTR